eukprot:Rmarinus@m.399
MPLPMDPTAAGSELLSILRPVMYTMFLTLYFVKDLEPDDDDDERIQFSTPAHEDESSSGSEKAKASIINSLYYVGLVTGMTFLLVLLMKYNCMKVIVAWITLSFSFMLSALGGLFVYMFCLKHDVALDIISFFVYDVQFYCRWAPPYILAWACRRQTELSRYNFGAHGLDVFVYAVVVWMGAPCRTSYIRSNLGAVTLWSSATFGQ